MTDDAKWLLAILGVWMAFIVSIWLSALILSVPENSWMWAPVVITELLAIIGCAVFSAYANAQV